MRIAAPSPRIRGEGWGDGPASTCPSSGASRHLLPAWGEKCAALALLAALSVLLLAAPALAQSHPFAVGANEGAVGAGTGIVGWILSEQGRFYKALTSAVREAKTSSAGFWLLAGLSFAYGVFHAAGPGHGKAVIASYMIANERALKHGLVLTFLAAMLQGAVAIAIVGTAALIFNATARRMTEAAQAIELVSYGAVAALGLWLVWTKGRAFVRELRFASPAPALAAAGAGGGGSASSRFVCDAIDPGHVHTADCGHFHAPDPATLDKNFSWGAGLATIVAAGARPCSGAILVLVFAMAQGVMLAGIGAVVAMSLGTALTTGALAAIAVLAKDLALRLTSGGGRSALVARGAELLAAIVVLVVGAGLLAGAWVNPA